jgi:glycosidase
MNPDSPQRDWYIWESQNPGYLGPWGEQVWHRHGSEYYYGVFWGGMPDLNLQNPEVTTEIYAIAQFWLEEMGVDGFRLDAIKHLVENGAIQENTDDTHAWLGDFYTFYKGVDSQALTVGEAWTNNAELLDYTGDEVDIAFAFDLADAFVRTARGSQPSSLIKELSEMVGSFPPGEYATFLTNHDQNRVMSELLGNQDQAKIAATLLLTSPGVPFLYYGEEIGMSGVKPDEDIRRPMQWHGEDSGAGMTNGTPWRPPASDYKNVNLALQVDDPGSLFNHYRALIHLRVQHPALSIGDWTLVDASSSSLYVCLRHTKDEVFLILVNVGREDLSAGEYGLTLVTGPLTGPVKAISHLGLQNPVSPEVNQNGGFANFTPFDTLPAHSFAVIQLVP